MLRIFHAAGVVGVLHTQSDVETHYLCQDMDISAVDMAWLGGWAQAENQVIMSFTKAPKPVEGWWLALFS